MPCYEYSIHALKNLLQTGVHNEKECLEKNTNRVKCREMSSYQDITTCLSFEKWHRILFCGGYL
jgi:hypothetical protein